MYVSPNGTSFFDQASVVVVGSIKPWCVWCVVCVWCVFVCMCMCVCVSARARVVYVCVRARVRVYARVCMYVRVKC